MTLSQVVQGIAYIRTNFLHGYTRGAVGSNESEKFLWREEIFRNVLCSFFNIWFFCSLLAFVHLSIKCASKYVFSWVVIVLLFIIMSVCRMNAFINLEEIHQLVMTWTTNKICRESCYISILIIHDLIYTELQTM